MKQALDARTHVSLEYHYDQDYDIKSGGTDEDNQKMLLGLGVKF